jgi:hypothetical protein
MKYPKILFVVLLATLFLAACSPAKATVKTSMGQPTSTGCSTPEVGKIGACAVDGTIDPTAVPTQAAEVQSDLTKSDAQGSVTVAVKPLNLDKPGDTLDFDVSMNTHSVDLGMDLAQLTTLATDTGESIKAVQWDALKGGHHVEGKLSFPTTLDGKNVLDGAKSITITIENLDAPVRIFTWQLNG